MTLGQNVAPDGVGRGFRGLALVPSRAGRGLPGLRFIVPPVGSGRRGPRRRGSVSRGR